MSEKKEKYGPRFTRLMGLFSRSLTEKNKQYVFDTYNTNEWDEVIQLFYSRRKWGHSKVITNNAVRFCKKAKEQLDISLFPLSERWTTPYKCAGEWSWTMRTSHHVPYEYGSADPISEMVKDKFKLHLGRDEEIGYEYVTKPESEKSNA